MSYETFLLPPVFDYTATFLWAFTGAVLAARHGYDIIGVVVVALASATGGGLLRDGLFLQNGPPAVVGSPVYLTLIVAASAVVYVFGRWIERMKNLIPMVNLFDGIGAGAYAVVGMNYAMAAGLSVPGIIFVGIVNAVGGGLLRDVLMNREPDIFRPNYPYAIAAFIGCSIFLALSYFTPLSQTVAAIITITTVFVIRLAAIRYNIKTQPLRAYEDHWNKKEGA